MKLSYMFMNWKTIAQFVIFSTQTIFASGLDNYTGRQEGVTPAAVCRSEGDAERDISSLGAMRWWGGGCREILPLPSPPPSPTPKVGVW